MGVAIVDTSQPSTDRAVTVRDLSIAFGSKVAVDHIDLDITYGSFFGLVGPNGAGKTTTLRMITGLLRPHQGHIWVHGVQVWREPVRAKQLIGVLPEDLRLFERLTGRELLTYTGLLRGMARSVVDERAEELLDVLGLREDARKFVVDYSHGMRKKVTLACALLHAPRVLFLDEPFEAIDPVSARTIRSVLERFTKTGGTVILSSHVMQLVERLCDAVAVIHEGRIVAQGSVREVRGRKTLEDAFIRLVGASDVEETELGWLATSSD